MRFMSKWWGGLIVSFGSSLGMPFAFGIFTLAELSVGTRIQIGLVFLGLGLLFMWILSIYRAELDIYKFEPDQKRDL